VRHSIPALLIGSVLVARPTEVGVLETPGRGRTAGLHVVYAGHVHVAGADTGSTEATRSNGSGVIDAASYTTACLVEPNGTLQVIDAADPGYPIEVGTPDRAHEDDVRPNAARGMRAARCTVYVMHRTWLQAVDVSDPRSPGDLGWIRAAPWAPRTASSTWRSTAHPSDGGGL
jgi:hypothetical protein